MAGNPKDSEWYSTPESARGRKAVKIRLSDAARARLKALAKKRKTSSTDVVEQLVMHVAALDHITPPKKNDG